MKKVNYIFPNIVAEMARNGDNLQTLAKKLGMGYQALSVRLQGKKSFELPEIFILMKLYKRSFETLFEENTGIDASTNPAA